MTDYRVYFLSAQNHILRALELMCSDDDDATREALRLAEGRTVELWQRGRMVRRLGPWNSAG